MIDDLTNLPQSDRRMDLFCVRTCLSRWVATGIESRSMYLVIKNDYPGVAPPTTTTNNLAHHR